MDTASETASYDFLFVATDTNVKKVIFTIWGYDDSYTKRRFSTGWDFHFLTQEEYSKRRTQFKGYLLALLGIVLFSIPATAVNFKKLTKKSKENIKIQEFLEGKIKVKGIGKKLLEKIKSKIEK